MMDYLLKFMLCSAVLYAFYHLLLRNDRSFRFNRYFLLSILVLALIIPVTIIKSTVVEVPMVEAFSTPVEMIATPPTSLQPVATAPSLDWEGIAINVYGIISLFLALRLIIHLISINRFRAGGKIVISDGLKVVLRSDINHSFSFLGSIFTNREAFENGEIPKEIIQHERAHVSQKHSYDILFMELMTCLFWFNPVIYLIKRAVKLNHEFLADESVIHQTGTLKQYQHIIINSASQRMVLNPTLASHLNYGETKKRLKIMTTQTKKGVSLLRQTGSMLIIITLFLWLGAEKVIAHQVTDTGETSPEPVPNTQIVQDAPPPRPPVLIRFNPEAMVRFKDEADKTVVYIFKELSKAEKQRFLGMKANSEVMVPPPPKAHITQAMLNDFQDAKKYGLWIDGERKDNTALNDYQLEDLHHFYKSRVSKHAKNYGKYEYHLDIVTVKNMENFLEKSWIPFKTQYLPKPGEEEKNGVIVIKEKND